MAREEDWDFYLCEIAQQPASVFLDLSWFEESPVSGLDQLLRVKLPMHTPREDGLSSQAEAEALHDAEDAIVEALESRAQARFVGRATWAGLRELYLYAPGSALDEATIEAALSSAPAYTARWEREADPDWTHYRELLYPDADARAQLTNRRMVHHLQSQGDALNQPRPINHMLYFPEQAQADACIEQARRRGFSAESQPADDARWGIYVALTREDTAQLEHLNALVHALRALATSHGGHYDGWGSPLTLSSP